MTICCPRCFELAPVTVSLCESCGCRLLPSAAELALAKNPKKEARNA